MAIYDVSTLGTAANQIVFNNFDASPLYRVVRRTPTKREVREFDIDLPESTGVADFQTFIGKTYFIIDGIMYPNDEIEFHSGREKLRKLSSLAVSQSDTSADFGYVPYLWTENVAKQMFVKVLYCDMQEATRQGIVQPFRLLCKIKYPIIFAQTPQNATLAVLPSLGGGAVLPTTLPAVLGSTAGSGTASLQNTGDAATYPGFTISGTINRPRITYVETGEYIELDVTLTGPSTSVIINYDQDTSPSLYSSGVNVYSKLTAGSTLFTIRSGTATFTLTGSSMGSDAQATISFLPAWPLS